MKSELDKFYDLIDDIKIAMMTTRRPDGHLESRAMANQKRAGGADLWFVRSDETTPWQLMRKGGVGRVPTSAFVMARSGASSPY